MNLIKLVLLTFVVFNLLSCKRPTIDKVDNFVNTLNAFYDNSDSGTNLEFIVMKKDTLRGSWIIVFEKHNRQYQAYDLNLWEAGMSIPEWTGANSNLGLTINDYAIGFDQITYLGSNLYIDSNDFVYSSIGSGHLKDLEKVGAFVEQYNIQVTANSLSQNFGFSQERSIEISKLLKHWKSTANSRAMTKEDADAFLSELVGFDFSNFENAISEESNEISNEMEYLLNKAAMYNGLNPEDLKRILDEYL